MHKIYITQVLNNEKCTLVTVAQPVNFVTPVKFVTYIFMTILKSFLLSSYGIYVYHAIKRSYSIYLNVSIACP